MATFIPVKRKFGNGWQAIIRRKGHKPVKRTFDLKSDALMAGADIRVIADILGHSTPQMALRYTHTLASHRQDVVDKISYLGG